MAHAVALHVAENDPRPVRRNGRRVIVQRPRVLIVDDECSVREFVDQVLREAGYTTARAVDGQDALAFAEHAGRFDLLLTDLVMPRMRGTELAERLRRVEPDLKVLYFTGYADRLFKEKGALWNDEAFLEKPANIDGLLEAVALLLDGHVRPTNGTGDIPGSASMTAGRGKKSD